MPNQSKRFKTIAITDGETEILAPTNSGDNRETYRIDFINIDITAGDVTIHKTAVESVSNSLVKASSSRILYPDERLHPGEVLYLNGANSSAGELNIAYVNL